MYLIDEQYVSLAEVREHGNKVAGLFDCRSGGYTHIYAHLVGYNGGKGRFSQPRRAVQQHMVKRLIAKPGSVDKNTEVILGLFLTYIFGDGFGPQTALSGILGKYG